MDFPIINSLTPIEKKKTPFYFLKDEVDYVKMAVHGIIASDKDPLIKYNTVVNFINSQDTVDNWLESLSTIPKLVIGKLETEDLNYFNECYKFKKFEELKIRIHCLNIPEENKQFMFDWIEREQKPIIYKRFWELNEAKERLNYWVHKEHKKTFEELFNNKTSIKEAICESNKRYKKFKDSQFSATWNHAENSNKPESQRSGWVEGGLQWIKNKIGYHQEAVKQFNPDILTGHSQQFQFHPSRPSMPCPAGKGQMLPVDIRNKETQTPIWMSEIKFTNEEQNKKVEQLAEKNPNEEQIKYEIAADALKRQEFHHQETIPKHEPLHSYTSTKAPSSISHVTNALPPPRRITKMTDIEAQISSTTSIVWPAITEEKEKTSPTLFPVDKPSTQSMIVETSKLIETAYETVEPPLTDEGLIVIDPLPALTIVSHSKIGLNTQESGQIKIDPANYFTILLVGSSGVGKTTFINSCANFLAHKTLEDAATNPTFLTELSFLVMKDSKQYEINVAANSGNHIESANEQGSKTNQPIIHLIPFGGKKKVKYLRIIDTPGLDDENEVLIKLEKKIGQIHAACIMIPHDKVRAVVSFRLLLSKIFNYFHQDALKNIFFCFMKTAAPSFLPGESFSLLEKQFKNLKVQINLKKELNIFTFNSECMKYISAANSKTKLAKSKFDSTFPNAESSWNHSSKEFFRLLERVQQLTPFEMSEIAIVDRNINTLAALTDSYRMILCMLCNSNLDIKHKRAKLIRAQEEAKKVPTQNYKLFCKSCLGNKRDFNAKTQRICFEETSTDPQKYKVLFDFPNFSPGKRILCTDCGCHHKNHEALRIITSFSSDQEKKEKEELGRLEEVNKDIEVECNQILSVCSNLFGSISKKVIATDKDPFLDYITQQLELENKKNVAGKQAPYKQYLEDTIKDYNVLVNISKEMEFSQQEIQQQVLKLQDLKFSGEFVKNAFEASN